MSEQVDLKSLQFTPHDDGPDIVYRTDDGRYSIRIPKEIAANYTNGPEDIKELISLYASFEAS